MKRLFTSLIAISIAIGPTLAQQTPPSEPPKPPTPAPHPLDPLTEDEFKVVKKTLKADGKSDKYKSFAFVHLQEPPKAEVLAFKTGDAIVRKAWLIAYDWKTRKTFEGVVDITNKKAISWTEMPGSQAPETGEENRIVERLVRIDPRWQEAVKKRGLDQTRMAIGTMPHRGYFTDRKDNHRYMLAMTFFDDPASSGSVDGLYVGVDYTDQKILWVRDSGEPMVTYNAEEYFNKEMLEKPRPEPKALKITQPDGASFKVDGHLVTWQNWRFRFGTDPRTGLVLYNVGYQDGEKLRPVLYRASIAELFVPYGDPSWIMMNWFDIGEFGLGDSWSPFAPMNDAPDNATYFPAIVADGECSPRTVPNAVAIYEKDGGVLWRHGDESRRARDLVIASNYTVGNYDYIFSWVFHEDGTIEQETTLTGLMQERATARKTDPADVHLKPQVGHLVAPNVEAPNHQHFFNFRLDLDVDGTQANRVFEMNTESLPAGGANPMGNGFVMKETPLRGELDAQRNVNLATSRKWVVGNPAVLNTLGQMSSYILVPGENSVPYAADGSYLRRIAGFADHHFWVTPYRPDEVFPGGNYMFDGGEGEGLTKWTAANRSIDYEDVVVWYTLGITHIPRIEDWPVMNAHRAGFKLVPAGFFSKNPALDVPKRK